MSRWLEAARQAPIAPDKTDLTDKTHVKVEGMGSISNPVGVKSVLSVLSAGGIVGETPAKSAKTLPPDLASYLAFLQSNGPASYGAAATALGWGATRAWQAEARLRAAGLAIIDKSGKAAPADRGALPR
jgi:hypothetical protein